MSLTVAGKATNGRDDIAVYGNGNIDSAPVIDTRLLPSGAHVDIQHDGVDAGTLVHAELDDGGALHCVAVLDDDWLLDFEHPVYFSPELAMVTRTSTSAGGRAVIAERAGLLGLSITPTPAGLSLPPLTILRGDVRDRCAQQRWEMSWASQHPLIARAAAAVPTLGAERHRARTITQRHDPALDDGYAGRPTGELWHRPCTILKIGGRPPAFRP